MILCWSHMCGHVYWCTQHNNDQTEQCADHFRWSATLTFSQPHINSIYTHILYAWTKFEVNWGCTTFLHFIFHWIDHNVIIVALVMLIWLYVACGLRVCGNNWQHMPFRCCRQNGEMVAFYVGRIFHRTHMRKTYFRQLVYKVNSPWIRTYQTQQLRAVFMCLQKIHIFFT